MKRTAAHLQRRVRHLPFKKGYREFTLVIPPPQAYPMAYYASHKTSQALVGRTYNIAGRWGSLHVHMSGLGRWSS